jgi:hypothetical protein
MSILRCSRPALSGRNRSLGTATERGGYNGAHLAAEMGMLQLDAANLIGGLVFGSIGFVAFVYGKRMNLWKIMFCGLALMIFPYFISDDIMIFLIGSAGTAALFFLRS